MLADGHGDDHIIGVVSELTHLLHGHNGGVGLVWQVDLEVLCDGGDEEAGEGEGRLAKDVADKGFRDVATD